MMSHVIKNPNKYKITRQQSTQIALNHNNINFINALHFDDELEIILWM